MALILVERHDATRRHDAGTALEDRLGRPLGARAHRPLALVQSGHDLTIGVEGEDAHARRARVLRREVDARLGARDQDGALGGITEDAPSDVGRGGQQTCVAAEPGGDQEFANPGDVVEGTLGGVADSRHARGGAVDVDLLDRHFTLGEGSRLVGADDVRRPQRLDGDQSFDEGVALGHPPNRDGQRDRQGGRESFGYECDHDAQGEDEGGGGGVAAEDPHGEQRGAGPDGHEGDASGHVVDLALQRARLAADLGGETVDATELGIEAGGEDGRLAGPVGDRGPHKDAIARFEGFAGLQRRLVAARDGLTLTGERGHLDVEGVRLHDPAIRGHLIAGVQEDQVAAHELVGRYLRQFTVAQNPRLVRHHGLEGLGGPFGRMLLEEPDEGVQYHHGHDAQGQYQVRRISRDAPEIGQQRQARRHDEDHDEHIGELGDHFEENTAWSRHGEFVGSVLGQPTSGLVGGETAR